MQALAVTCRPHFRPWLEHEIGKQEHPVKLLVFDDCSQPTYDGAVRPSNRLQLTLGEKRQMLLDLVTEPFAWFDDDDWLPKERLEMSRCLDLCDAVGYHTGTFIDVKTLQTRRIETGTSLVFNGAVFAPHCAKVKMQPVNRGEDTLWLQQVLKDATVCSSPVMEHGWLSGDWNVTGKRGSLSFEGPRFARLDSWERAFIAAL